jgi:hypothetical protein
MTPLSPAAPAGAGRVSTAIAASRMSMVVDFAFITILPSEYAQPGQGRKSVHENRKAFTKMTSVSLIYIAEESVTRVEG